MDDFRPDAAWPPHVFVRRGRHAFHARSGCADGAGRRLRTQEFRRSRGRIIAVSMARRLMAVLVFGVCAVSVARAQDRSTVAQQIDPLGRLNEGARYQIELLLDSARVAGLPTAPLESKALEGISKRVEGRRIVVAVRMVFRSLRDARSVLGTAATADELNAAASALRVGVTRAELAHLTQMRREKSVT